MTTNNHPAHGPVSLDRLHQISEILSKAAAQSDGGNLGYAMADAVKVIDGAIAAFSNEPVAWTDEKELRDAKVAGIGYLFGIDKVANKFADPRRQIMLYRHAQPVPVVPDGYVIVPIVPTEDMIINGFESVPDPHFSDEKEWEEYEALSGCRQAARRAELCWAAMIKAAPKQENI
ncbi:hypothetical protein FW706_05210 [Salmonella enterica subsp. enterica serovar Gatuni]|nr:hypothetical protein [Salmonella enterica subsp. enterica serovar Gatuni]